MEKVSLSVEGKPLGYVSIGPGQGLGFYVAYDANDKGVFEADTYEEAEAALLHHHGLTQ